VNEKPLDPLTLEIYTPGPSGRFTIFEPDHADIQVKYQFDGEKLRLETSRAPGRINVILYERDIQQAWLEENSLVLTRTKTGGWQFSYDGRKPAQVTLITAD
jgi:hypothetical protein